MTEPPIRVLLAKVGLDGHDRGVKVVARTLRDVGMEVIYTGLWQSPESVVRAATEEDVDLVGVSLLSAAHMTLVPRILELLRADNATSLPLVVGGIVPGDDAKELVAMGASAVLGPEFSLATVVDTVQSLALKHRESLRQYVVDQKPKPWRLTLARTLSTIRDNGPSPSGHRACWVGVTGPPGVGKSTLIGKLIAELRKRGKKVAVLAVDPSSPISGGALLGDRARMDESSDDADVFVRSVAARGQSGGLAGSLPGMLAVIDEHGFDVVLIETVGIGQADYDICRLADTSVLLFMPGAGDELQLEKAGVIEVADIIVVNKADRPEADKLFAEARETLGDGRRIIRVSALRNEGVDELVNAILEAGP